MLNQLLVVFFEYTNFTKFELQSLQIKTFKWWKIVFWTEIMKSRFMIKMGEIDFTDWLTKCTLVSSDCILHRHTDWMTNHQEGKDLIYWCLRKKLSSGPPDSAVLSRHSGSRIAHGLEVSPVREHQLEGPS